MKALAEEIARWAYGREGLNKTPRIFEFEVGPVFAQLEEDATLLLRVTSRNGVCEVESGGIQIIGIPNGELVAEIEDILNWFKGEAHFLTFKEEEEDK